VEERLQARLNELRAEYQKGEQTLADLETKIGNVRATMLRISGAIQVLEEFTQPASNGDREASLGEAPSIVGVPAIAD
jgi:prefoldin subunit 5